MLVADGSRFVMIGDSVTDAGRVRPVGRKQHEGLGSGYVRSFDAMLASRYPQRNIEVLNIGCSGHNVVDLSERWQTDVLDLKPQWLSIMIGVNDVWRHYDSPCRTDLIDIHTYENTYIKIIEQVRDSLDGLILAGPHFIEPNKQDPMRQQMDAYGAVVQKLAQKYDAIYVDPQAGFDEFLQHKSSHYLAWDRIHPNPTGHQIIADAFLRGIEFQWSD
ncbi:MAG: SGNH/GDSL hydrolase family protein [Planctomycetes bacterium]|nr:SGNH/GDSL hydrolase family protein [Planctomycetota bacterium]